MMTPTDFPLTDLAAVDLLGADLLASDYHAGAVPAALGADAHRCLGQGSPWPALAVTGRQAAAGSTLATLIRLFLLGTSEPAERVAAALPRLGVDGGVACGVLESIDDPSGARRIQAGLDIRPHADETHSYLVVSDLDSDTRPGPLRPDHVLGIGSASMTLARAITRQPVARVLDIGTGCGIQALHCFAHADAVTATDTNPRALALAGATARLNGQRWELRHGSLFDPVVGEQFDLIVANPPFVISAGDQHFEYRDSGVADDGLCADLVTRVADYLTPGGTAQVLANWLIVGDEDWRQRVGSWVAPTGCDGWVVQRDVASPAEYASLWLADTGEVAETSIEQRTRDWLDYFVRQQVTGIGMGTITLRKPAAPTASTADVVFDELTGPDDVLTGREVDTFLARRAYLAEQSDADLLASTFSLADTAALRQHLVPSSQGWQTVLRMLRRPGGPGATLQLDEWGQALLAGCQGSVPLEAQVALLASAHHLDPAALAAAVMPAIRTAVTRGLVHPVDVSAEAGLQ